MQGGKESCGTQATGLTVVELNHNDQFLCLWRTQEPQSQQMLFNQEAVPQRVQCQAHPQRYGAGYVGELPYFYFPDHTLLWDSLAVLSPANGIGE